MPRWTRDLVDEAGDFSRNRVRLLVDGPATYSEMRAAIGVAQSYIYMATYGFGDESESRRFADLLKDRARAGVQVWLQYDAFGSLDTEEAMFEDLMAAGVRLTEYNPLTRFETMTSRTVNVRDHRKILVVDGRTGFTGGVNISEQYATSSVPHGQNEESEGWRDTHVRLAGPAVLELAGIFESRWDGADSPAAAAAAMDSPDTPEDTEQVALRCADGDRPGWSAIREEYLHAIESAQQRIWITQAYFAPDPAFLERLTAAASRGVDVRLVLPAFSDIDLAVLAARARYASLLKAGARVFEFEPAVVHAKTAVIDGAWSTVGSSNLDSLSFRHNLEINVIVVGTNFANQLEQQFEQDQLRSVEIERTRWLSRPLMERVKERVAKAIDYWI